MLYEKFGQQTRFRFQLCKRYLHNRCGSGKECHYIHSKTVPTSTWVHVNENCVTALGSHTLSEDELNGSKNNLKYITMPSGVLFRIYPPNQTNAPPQLIPSNKLLYTIGATNVYRVLVRCLDYVNSGQDSMGTSNTSNNCNNNVDTNFVGGVTTNNNNYDDSGSNAFGGSNTNQFGLSSGTMTMSTLKGFSLTGVASRNPNTAAVMAHEMAKLKPRHCAHFQFKRMCNLGTSCNFIHSLVPFIQGIVNQPALP
uniref:C3H1-type domain-containing protein n=1 Tax=Lygus hesperus TaxID=30085 RepID=A0A0A9WQC7_LYGHE